MAWSGHCVMDPSEMEGRYAQEEGMAFLESIFDTVSETSLDRIEKVRDVMTQLPDLEADFVELHYFLRWKQTSIAALFGVTQPTVHYRLGRATARIRYLMEMPHHDPEVMRKDLSEFLVVNTKPLDGGLNVQIMMLMLETTCQTAVANILGITQGKARHRFLTILDKLASSGVERHQTYAAIFQHVRGHLNMMWEVQTPTTQEVTYTVV